jgi:hypothetical protein
MHGFIPATEEGEPQDDGWDTGARGRSQSLVPVDAFMPPADDETAWARKDSPISRMVALPLTGRNGIFRS